MKKLIAVIMAAVLLLGCGACAKKDDPADRLEQIKARGYIEVCTEPYFAPFEFMDSSKPEGEQYVGLDIELAKYIADKLGVELRIVPLEFSALLAGMSDGKYDLAISALAYSPARAQAMSMSKSYYTDETATYGLLVREEDADKYTSIEDLADAVLVTQSGSVQESIVKDQIPERKELKLVSSMTDGFLMISEDKADVCICAATSAQLYADANGGLVVPEFRFTVDAELSGTRVVAPLGADTLTEFVNTCIDELEADGKLADWYEEYAAYAKTLGLE